MRAHSYAHAYARAPANTHAYTSAHTYAYIRTYARTYTHAHILEYNFILYHYAAFIYLGSSGHKEWIEAGVKTMTRITWAIFHIEVQLATPLKSVSLTQSQVWDAVYRAYIDEET